MVQVIVNSYGYIIVFRVLGFEFVFRFALKEMIDFVLSHMVGFAVCVCTWSLYVIPGDVDFVGGVFPEIASIKNLQGVANIGSYKHPFLWPG